ncbi:hypothetical protein [Cryobacterium soli]|uniref:hypothetical protein n=1 Tax=Cryobacterium soli TaxID=2220095 RepID=UPI0013C4BB3E|nr:hypothetical protein [Cryobacterium soli]
MAESMQREYDRGRSLESANIFERIRVLDHERGGNPIAVLNDAIYLKVDPKYIFKIVEKAITRPTRWDWYDAKRDDSNRIADSACAALEATLRDMKRPRTLLQSDERYADVLPILTALWDSSGRKKEKYRQASAESLLATLGRVHRAIEQSLLPLPAELWTAIQWTRLRNQFRADYLASLDQDAGEQEVSRLLELLDNYTRAAFESLSPSTQLDNETNLARAQLAHELLRSLAISALAYPEIRPVSRREMARRVTASAMLWIDYDSSVSSRLAWAYAELLDGDDRPIEDLSEILLDDFGEGVLAMIALRSNADLQIAEHLADIALKEKFWSKMPGAFSAIAVRLAAASTDDALRPSINRDSDALRSLVRAHIRSVVSDMLVGNRPDLVQNLAGDEYESRVLMFYGAELRAEISIAGEREVVRKRLKEGPRP